MLESVEEMLRKACEAAGLVEGMKAAPHSRASSAARGSVSVKDLAHGRLAFPDAVSDHLQRMRAVRDLMPFVENLLQEAGFKSLPSDFRTNYVTGICGQIEARLGVAAVALLDDQHLEDIERVLEAQGSDALVSFFQAHIPDFETKMAVVLQEFRSEFIAQSVAIREHLHKALTLNTRS